MKYLLLILFFGPNGLDFHTERFPDVESCHAVGRSVTDLREGIGVSVRWRCEELEQ